MTTTDPRERLALRRRNPLAAAVRLESAADAMRADVLSAAEFARLVDPVPAPEAADFEEPAPVPALIPPTPAPAPAPVVPEPFSSEQSDEDRGPWAGEYGADYGTDHPDPCLPGCTCGKAPTNGRRLNWRSNHDERSRLFGVRGAVVRGAVPLQPVLLSTGPTLDQGAEGACFGFAGIDAVNALDLIRRPGATDLRGGADALELYRLAQRRDEVPGEAYSGTSVTGGMRAGQELGLWGGYRWCFGTADIAQTLLRRLPVIIGIPWFAGMYATGPRGVVTVSGDQVGGHCLAVVGMQMTGPNGEPGIHFIWQNSWGPDYGDEGLGYIAHRTLATLLHSHGEAAVPMVTPQAPAVAA